MRGLSLHQWFTTVWSMYVELYHSSLFSVNVFDVINSREGGLSWITSPEWLLRRNGASPNHAHWFSILSIWLSCVVYAFLTSFSFLFTRINRTEEEYAKIFYSINGWVDRFSRCLLCSALYMIRWLCFAAAGLINTQNKSLLGFCFP